jgi:hypothetical protein
MPKRGPTDTDRTTPPADGDVEVVNAAGERKSASLPKRVLAAARDTLSMTDQPPPRPPWLPGELADDDAPTLVVSNADVERLAADEQDQQPPAQAMRELRRRRARDVEQRVGMAAAKVAGLVELDRWNRLYAIHIHHLASLAGLQAAAVEALQNRDLPTAVMRALFRAELDEWERDIEAGGS